MKLKQVAFTTLALSIAVQSSLKAQETTPAVNKVNVSGYVNARYQYSDVEQNFTKGKNGFDIRRARLDFKGNATSTLGYRLQVDFATAPKVIDAYLEWKPLKNLSIQGGQFKIPFSLENPYSPLNQEAIDNSQVISKLVTDIAGKKSNGRDIGLQVAASFLDRDTYHLIDVKVGIFNGNLVNEPDNNTTKDLVASLFVNPVQPLSILGSYYQGEYGEQTTKVKRERYGFGAKYDDKNLLLRSEYITGTDAETQKDGYYLTAGYFITSKWQPVVKYDSFRSNKNDADSRSTQILAGLNYTVVKNTRLQLNYTRTDLKKAGTKGNNQIAAQVLVAF